MLNNKQLSTIVVINIMKYYKLFIIICVLHNCQGSMLAFQSLITETCDNTSSHEVTSQLCYSLPYTWSTIGQPSLCGSWLKIYNHWHLLSLFSQWFASKLSQVSSGIMSKRTVSVTIIHTVHTSLTQVLYEIDMPQMLRIQLYTEIHSLWRDLFSVLMVFTGHRGAR